MTRGQRDGWVPKPASGIPATTAEKGNALAVRHGAYAVLQLSPRAAEIAQWVRSLGEHLAPADEPAVQTLALMLAQLERADGVLGEVDAAIKRGDDVDVYLGRVESRGRLSQDARRWADSARRMLDDLGLTPAGRAALEDRLQIVIPAHLVKAGFEAWFKIAAKFVDPAQWDAFGDEVMAMVEELETGVRELPLIDVEGS